MRNKLIDIIEKAQAGNIAVQSGAIADALLEAGVILNEWIPVSESRPGDGPFKSCNGDYLCTVMRPIRGGNYHKETRVIPYDSYGRCWQCEGMIVTHWMPAIKPAE